MEPTHARLPESSPSFAASPHDALWPALAFESLGLVPPVAAQRSRLRGTPANGQSINGFHVSRDGRWIVYQVLPGGALWSVPSSGRGSSALIHDPSDGPLPRGFEISPDSRRVLYIGEDPSGAGQAELFSIPIDGHGGRVKLNAPLATSWQSVSDLYLVTPDGRQVVYIAPQDSLHPELYVVPIDRNQAPRKLNGPLVRGGAVTRRLLMSPDGSRVVYHASQDSALKEELYSVPLDGSRAPVKLNLALGASDYVMTNFQLTPDGSRVFFDINYRALFCVPIDGSRPAVLLDSLAPPAPAF